VFALHEITKKTKNVISIGNLRFLPFNHLLLENVYAGDLKNDTLFFAEKIIADFDFLKLFRKEIVIHSVAIEQLKLHISKDSVDAPLNFQFLIDAFVNDTSQPEKTSNLLLCIDHILLKNGCLHYDVFSESSQAPGIFDVNHTEIRNLQLDAILHYNNPNDWNGSVDSFSFDEKCGFRLKQMMFQIKNYKNRLSIERFRIALPHSEGEIKEANLDYTGLTLNQILSGATYSLHFTSGKWYPGDFEYFYRGLAEYTDSLTCSGEIKGKFPGISIPNLELNYGKQLQLSLSAYIADYAVWDTSAFQLKVEKGLIDPKLFSFPFPLKTISISGEINGSLPNLKLTMSAENKQNDLTINGTGGYNVSSGNIRFDIAMELSRLDLKTLFADSAFGNASFRLTSQGIIADLNKITTKTHVEIRQFDYSGYSYRDIMAKTAYTNDTVSVELISKDPGLPVILEGKAGLDKKNSFIQLQAQVNGVRPDVLNLLPEFPDSKLSGNLSADIRGFDPERMTASCVIDNLHWATPAGDFSDSPITFTYTAGDNRQKQINFRSPTLNIRGKGSFSFEGIAHSFLHAFPGLVRSNNNPVKKRTSNNENFDFLIGIRHTNAIAHLLGMETTIPDSALFIGKYYTEDKNLNLNITAFCIFPQSDTLRLQLNLSNDHENTVVQTKIKNKSNQYDLEGNIEAALNFIPNKNQEKPTIKIALKPGEISLNGTVFQIRPSQIAIENNRYDIDNFALQHSRSEFIKFDGVISENTDDSLRVTVNRFEIGTILSALKNKIPLSGNASGDITFSRLMTKPLIFTRKFTIDNLIFDGNEVGNLQLRSIWSSERQGLALRVLWIQPNASESVVSGFVSPEKDSLAFTSNIQGIHLDWLNGYLPNVFSGLAGELSAQMKIAGKLSNPVFSGMLYLNDATVLIPTLNTRYRMNDSIALKNDQIVFDNCMIYDETNQYVKLNGSIRHNRFSNLTPKLTLDFNRFLVLNNSEQTDSIFYGLIRVDGNLSILSQNKDWLIKGKLSNGRNNKIMINLPETTLEAERYNWLTFVEKGANDSITVNNNKIKKEVTDFSLPLKFQATLSIDQNLSIGAVINPDTKDAAIVTGRGVLDFSYNWPNPVPRLLGNYVIEDGKCSLSLINITKKTFSVQQGGRLNFQGDPMNTTFDLSAIYSLRAYLSSLDPSFESLTTSSKIPVNCVLTAAGKLDNMKLKYQINLPNQTNEVQRKMDGLIYSDEIKVKQIAYLLAFGSFLPINSNSMNNGIWTSLASSSITSQLNNLLSGVLSNNWTIGTDLHSMDSNFSDVDMDVNISTRLFNDRLTLNSTLGYHNNTDEVNNFTGDFNLEYKLTPRGNLLLQFYNVTNNQYYDRSRSPLTQGVGVVYKREGRTFRQLFRSLWYKRQAK